MMSLTPVSCRISVSKGNDTALKKLQVGSAVINDHLLTKIRVIFYCFWRVAVKLPFFYDFALSSFAKWPFLLLFKVCSTFSSNSGSFWSRFLQRAPLTLFYQDIGGFKRSNKSDIFYELLFVIKYCILTAVMHEEFA